jgi:hypothetical protein
MKRVVIFIVAGLLLAGCAGARQGFEDGFNDGFNSASADPTAATAAPIPATTAPAEPEPGLAAAPTAPTQSWAMPALVGENLQDAQDRIQQLTGFAVPTTFSHDLRGDRAQVLDRNWVVCKQNVAPGQVINSATKIDFGVVKDDESC